MLATLSKRADFVSAKTVLLYYALPDEVPTLPLLERWGREKTLLLPVVLGDDLTVRVYARRADLQPSAYGIQEPVGDDFSALTDIEMALIPGVAFDKRGYRCGRGRGYYDRFLARPELAHLHTIGVGYDFQLFETIPTEQHDLLLHELILL